MLTLDGSHGEGGGQIVRTAIFLSLLLDKPFQVTRIRAGRTKSGLKPQHVAILRLVADMTGSQADGVVPGSPEITFRPGTHRPGSWKSDIGTAGCIPLLLQTILPIAIATPGATRVEVTGGTHVPFGPTMDWMREAYVPYLSPLAEIRLETLRHGFAPEGGGRVELEVVQKDSAVNSPDGLRALVKSRLGHRRLQQGKVAAIGIRSIATRSLGKDIVNRQAMAALAHLVGLGATPTMSMDEVEADGVGTSITCHIEDSEGNRLASDRLGEKRSPAENVGRIAAVNLLEDWKAGGTVDRHLADHIVPWVALGAGAVRVPHVTQHLSTNGWVCEQFLGPNTVRTDRNLVR